MRGTALEKRWKNFGVLVLKLDFISKSPTERIVDTFD